MERIVKSLILTLAVIWATASVQLYAQSTKNLDGVQYTVIDPVTFSFNADSGKIKVGETYVIEGQVTMTSGANLYIKDISAKTTFVLNSPMKLETGTKITAYVKIAEANQFGAKANIVKLEGPGIPSGTATNAVSTKSLDGVQYTVIDPVTFSFNADSGKIKVGETYVIEGQVTMTSGANLYIKDISAKTTFVLNSPVKLDTGKKITAYVKIVEANQFGAKANIIKLE